MFGINGGRNIGGITGLLGFKVPPPIAFGCCPAPGGNIIRGSTKYGNVGNVGAESEGGKGPAAPALWSAAAGEGSAELASGDEEAAADFSFSP